MANHRKLITIIILLLTLVSLKYITGSAYKVFQQKITRWKVIEKIEWLVTYNREAFKDKTQEGLFYPVFTRNN